MGAFSIYRSLASVKISIFFLCFLSFQTFSLGFEVSPEVVEAFQQSWVEDYTPLTCSDNIIKLSKRDLYFKNAKVVHIFHKHIPYAPIHPLMARGSARLINQEAATKSWLFHAFLLIDKKIVFDLDFSNSPQISNIENYLETMWPKEDLKTIYRFQIKEISSYSEYDTDGFMNDHPVLEYIDLLNYLSI